MAITTKQIKELRDATGAGMMDCKEALVNADGDFDKAVDFLREKGLAKAAKRAGREASEGIVELYSHGDGRIGVMVEVNCETDFVSRSDSFRTFAHEIDKIVDGRIEKFKDEVVLLRQAYIRDGAITVQDLLNETISSIGENIVVRRFTRWELGEHSQEDDEE
jgi:elongation factor Ts